MGEFHKRVMSAIHAEIKRSGTYPNALYLGRAERQQLDAAMREVETFPDPNVMHDEFAGLTIYDVNAESHFNAAWRSS